MISATAKWPSGKTITKRFLYEISRNIWIDELNKKCQREGTPLPAITKGDDSHEPRKKLWGRFGMEAEITESEFDLLQCGGHDAAALLTALLESHRLHLTGETYFPAVSKSGFHEFGDEINLDI